ncbi:DUF1801 domain-containing protein [Aldersonia kunmingensis]|uniref:DUF1801 domain-containing protein n=1 Tax=Aldersonia kunmingensis TaxID=408066 RepID=UPI001FE01326|nr:DUF1801 domain-containing protein [Aldersonia kunmingensis]
MTTAPTTASVTEFLESVSEPGVRADCTRLVTMLNAATGEPPVMWGSSMIGFGARHYKYASGHEGDTFLIGFAPRSKAITLYLTLNFDEYTETLARLGKHKLGKGCLYLTKLDDVDRETLAELVTESVSAARTLS